MLKRHPLLGNFLLPNTLFIIITLNEMRRLRNILLAAMAAICCFGVSAQELNCTFEVDSKKVKNAMDINST